MSGPRCKAPENTQLDAKPEAPVQGVVFTRPWRCFNRGRKITFRPGVNLLVGDQGSGKSTLLELITSYTSSRKLENEEARKTIKLLVGANARVMSFDFERDNPRTLSHFHENADMMGFQIASRHRSHGETALGLINSFVIHLTEKPKPDLCVVLLDEPDMALSPRSARKLARAFDEIAAAGHQVIAAVHNPIVIASQDEVYSLEHRRWMSSKTFLAKHTADD